MLNRQRTFVDAVKKYCAERAIDLDVRSQDWLIAMKKGAKRRFAYGYDLGLNGAVTHRIATDKAATAEVLQMRGIACVPHALFLSPKLSEYTLPGSREEMLRLLDESREGVVVKPNEGTSGYLVSRVRTRPKLETAVNRIFSLELNVAIAPYFEIEDEVRVILLDEVPLAVYTKRRPSVTGDGVHTLLELAHATLPADRLSATLHTMTEYPDSAALDMVLPSGQQHVLSWRHNLDSGAEPVLLLEGPTREACVRIAIEAAKTIELRFGSIDVIQADGRWRVLEINSAVMMEALSRRHPELVYAAYSAALDKVFG
jgi:glutathione synthase/RimK-type ligase-like ATP-grasp enzyme